MFAYAFRFLKNGCTSFIKRGTQKEKNLLTLCNRITLAVHRAPKIISEIMNFSEHELAFLFINL